MELKLLIDKLDAVPTIAKWYFTEWGSAIPDNSYEKTLKSILGKISRDKLPTYLLCIDKDDILGVAQLKIREMTIYPDKEYWLGGLFVNPAFRKKGIASSLEQKIVELAKSRGIERLHLQTERLDGGLYRRLGWQPVEKTFYNGFHVLVMEKLTGACHEKN